MAMTAAATQREGMQSSEPSDHERMTIERHTHGAARVLHVRTRNTEPSTSVGNVNGAYHRV